MGMRRPRCYRALNSVKNFVCTIWFFERPIRVQSLGYVVLTQAAICVSELSILLTCSANLPTGFLSWCSCIPICGRRLRPRMFARRSFTTIKEAVWIVQPPDSIGAIRRPRDEIVYPLSQTIRLASSSSLNFVFTADFTVAASRLAVFSFTKDVGDLVSAIKTVLFIFERTLIRCPCRSVFVISSARLGSNFIQLVNVSSGWISSHTRDNNTCLQVIDVGGHVGVLNILLLWNILLYCI